MQNARKRNPSKTVAKRKSFGNKHSGTALMSLQEIGDLFGVRLQSIQAIEQRALRKIRKAIEFEAAKENKTVAEWLYCD